MVVVVLTFILEKITKEKKDRKKYYCLQYSLYYYMVCESGVMCQKVLCMNFVNALRLS